MASYTSYSTVSGGTHPMRQQMVSRDFWYTRWSRGAISLLRSFRSLRERLFGLGVLCALRHFRSFSNRPVSLTSVCCKIMEHVLASNIMRHGEHNGILYQLQHGFRRNRSCETQLIEFIDDLHSLCANLPVHSWCLETSGLQAGVEVLSHC
jgi:hypothetical protein